MPQPPVLLGLEQPLIDAYAQAWREITAEQQAIVDNPLKNARRARLREMQASVEAIIDDLDAETLKWVSKSLPRGYAAGAATGAQQVGGEYVWNQIHQEAVQNLVNRAYTDLLDATKHTADTTKKLVRTLVRDQTVQKAIQGRTAVDAGRRVSKILESKGIHSVVYKDGSKHGLKEYGQMVVRTVSATAYNEGTLNAAHSLGVVYWEVFDGPDCGWTTHGGGDLANGKIVTRDEALAWPISHPNCRRAFGARPDITTPEQAKETGRSTTREQDEAIRKSDESRGARVERRSAGRPTAADRLAEREAKLAEREAARLAAEEAARPKEVTKYKGLVQDQIAGVRTEHEGALLRALGDTPTDEAIRDWLVATNPNPADPINVIYGGITPEVLKIDKTVATAVDWYQSMLTKDAMEHYTGFRPTVTNGGKLEGRAFYDSRNRELGIGQRKARTTVHELGHHFENEMRGYQTRASGFRRYRAGDEKVTTIYRGTDEVGWKDKFINHYMGKNYPGQRDTEILSMGFEMLYAEPSRFLKKDPEYFWFMVGLLRGQIATAA